MNADKIDPPPVVSVKINRVSDYAKELHTHPHGELIYNLKGNVTCTVYDTLWIIPPQCAFYIPAHTPHIVRSMAGSNYCILFIHKKVEGMPLNHGFMTLSPMLKEMILHMSAIPRNIGLNQLNMNLAGVMLGALSETPLENATMPIPYSSKIRIIADALATDPSDRKTLTQWAKIMGMSEKTLARLVIKETGLTFGQWRQQFQISMALNRLESGLTIQQTAWELGYESVNAFISMFKKHFGKPPRKYIKENSIGTDR